MYIGSMRSIIYISLAILPAGRSCAVLNMEVGDIFWAIQRYLWSTKFVIDSDHSIRER